VQSELTQPLLVLADRWRRMFRAPRWRVTIAVLFLAGVLSALGARAGTIVARRVALGSFAVMVAAAGASIGLERHRRRDLKRILLGPVRDVDRARADKALRALSLVGPDGDVRAEGTSQELARLHVVRVLADLPVESTLSRGARLAAGVGAAGLLVAAVALALTAANGWSVVEGADVLFARGRVAPVSMQWLEDVEVVARPPDYLHAKPIFGGDRSPLVLPYGSMITVRGVPVRAGRSLFLTDGKNDVSLVDDGSATVVGRWFVGDTVILRVVARFGDVVIPEAPVLKVTSISDAAPVVRLEEAPRQVLLVDAEDDVPIRYEATDDHGLREVHLVLNSAAREERRVLARLDGETTSDRGGYLLRLRDPFLAKSHAPVQVTVEAKDNDPLTGPKWGSSEAITIVPPAVGESEARCLEGLRKLRSVLVDTLDWHLAREMPNDPAPRAAFAKDDEKRTRTDERVLSGALAAAYGGVRVPSPLRAILVAGQEALTKAVAAETRAPSPGSRADVVRASERFVLVTDAVVRGLGARGARTSAKELSDVADDLGLGLGQEQNETIETRSRGVAKVDASTRVLSEGGRVLLRLGMLGHDLGEIVETDLLRIKRAIDAGDLAHAELAARDLATRLRQPDASFSSHGGSARGVSEAGGEVGEGDEAGEAPDDVERAFAAAQDLDRLAQDHAGAVGKTEGALAGTVTDGEMNDLRREGKEHAKAVREAVRNLPRVGEGSQSWTSKGAAARDLAEQMARALEEARDEDALQSGRSAVGSLDEAKRLLERGKWMSDPTGERLNAVDEARHKMEAEARWAEDQVREMHRRAAERARGDLQEGSEEEQKLADRARDLAERGLQSGALPQEAIEAIGAAERSAREAAEALKHGEGERGLERQRQAQRDLEAARGALQGTEESRVGAAEESPAAPNGAGTVEIPKTHKGPDEFRRRVMRGFTEPAGGSIQGAWRRYAEGLLR
jgi:hypothetical protein